mmetsp:Transcript_96762/g.270853  ORF Transcript_96762/g.270853 Transcript_96762/m.270853 type:complete len:239 (+) Transcript_96762:231-947(+)
MGLSSRTLRFAGFSPFLPCGAGNSTQIRSAPWVPRTRPCAPFSSAAERECASTRAPAGKVISKAAAFSSSCFTASFHGPPKFSNTSLCPAPGQTWITLSRLPRPLWHCVAWSSGTISSLSPCMTSAGQDTAANLPRVSKGSGSIWNICGFWGNTMGTIIFTIGNCLIDIKPESTMRPWISAACFAARCTAQVAPMERPCATRLAPPQPASARTLRLARKHCSVSAQSLVKLGWPVPQL